MAPGGSPTARTSPSPDAFCATRIELRQLRYFVSLAEELHFGRAAAREHIVQSALSQQVQRLERTLGVLLVRRTTRHIELTPAGARFLIEARQILEHVDRAAGLAQGLTSAPPSLRVGLLDEGYAAVRPVLRALETRHPELDIHQVQVGVSEQIRMLADGRLDVGVGRTAVPAPEIASQLFRLDRLGVLVPPDHRFARLPAVPVAALAGEMLELLPGTGSMTVAGGVTVAVLVSGPVRFGAMVPVTRNVTWPPRGIDTGAPMLPVPLGGHMAPGPATHVQFAVVRTGKVSVTVAPTTSEGPLLVTVIV